MQSWAKARGTFFFFLTPALFWVVFFFLTPMFFLWLYSFGHSNRLDSLTLPLTLENYKRVFDPVYLNVFWNSVWISLITTLITLCISLPVAFVIAFSSSFWRPWLLFLVILPFWTNMLIRTYALMIIFRTHGLLNIALSKLVGLLNSLLAFVGGPHLIFEPLNFLYSKSAVVLGLVYISLPFMIFPLYIALEKLDKAYIEASLDLGAGLLITFFRIILPLILPGIISGSILTFIPNLGAYLIPDLLGGARGVMISSAIAAQFKSMNDWPFGSALSFVLMYITFFILLTRTFFLKSLRQTDSFVPPPAGV